MVSPVAASDPRLAQAWALLAELPDPELPALSLCDLGVVRSVSVSAAGSEVALTPTYSGCPATEVIAASVVQALDAAGLGPTRTHLQRAPAWSSDWISAAGRAKLLAYGIAPPGPAAAAASQPLRLLRRPPTMPCPRCASARTELLAVFGGTACKALYRCIDCREPFEHFKPI